MPDGKVIALTPTSERSAATSNGYAMLIVLLLVVLADAYAIYSLPRGPGGTDQVVTRLSQPWCSSWSCRVLHAAAQSGGGDHPVRRLSRYRPRHRPALDLPVDGQEEGVGPRNNFISDKIKVNDLRGNPIAHRRPDHVARCRHGAGLVRRRRLQAVCSRPGRGRDSDHRLALSYDDFEHQEVTLRGNHDQVGVELRKELQDRLSVAGITIDECGFTYLAYASNT